MAYDLDFAETESEVFNSYLRLFNHFYDDDIDEQPVDKDIPVDSSFKIE